MKRNLWIGACMAVVALSAQGCDKGGVVYRDLGGGAADVIEPADGAVVAEDAAAEVAAEVVSSDVPAKAEGVTDAVVMQPNIPSKSFRFEMSGRDGEAFLVDVIGRDLGTIYGVALRVQFDPAAVEYVETIPAPVFGADGEKAVYKAALVRSGSVTIGSMLKSYLEELELTGDVKIATLKLKPLSKTASELRFFTQRCLVVDRRLDKIEATYLGSTLHP